MPDDKQKERCEEQGHKWENCCSAFLQVYQRCKWCGETRNVSPTPLLERDVYDD
jgi:hypothetical protein